MVNPSQRSFGRALLLSAGAALAGGCGLTPKSQLDECRLRGQALRAENDRLKDQVLTLRSENQDVAQRSVDDERRLKAQDDAIERLEQSVQSYQDDRERLATAYDRLKAQIQGTAGPEAARQPAELERFARDHAGASFDATASVLTLPVDLLFFTGSPKLRPEADAILKDLTLALSGPDLKERDLLLVTVSEDASVEKASQDENADESARMRFLAMARADQLRQRLVASSREALDRIRIADPDRAPVAQEKPQTFNTSINPPLEIRLARSPLKSGPTGP
ncbi:MAG: hypothetical protein P4L84_28405 [Isosphaeraceae bacterium]|nr:hypothetical protein [Isosphaeraceae bacterium]